MNREQALYFLEGLIAGVSSPDSAVAKALFRRLSRAHDLIRADFEVIRPEIDTYLNEAEAEGEMYLEFTKVRARG